MEGYEIGIVETRNLVRTLQEVHNYDFSGFALTSFKRRVERCMLMNNIKNADALLVKLREDKLFINKFLTDTAIESTEMFRDPSLWRWLRDEYIQASYNPSHRFKIWLPQCVSGDELYTLTIVLKETNLLDKVKILAGVTIDEFKNRIQEGILFFKKVDTSNENYKRYQGVSSLTNYYTISDGKAVRDTSLIESVEFENYNIISDPPQKDMKLILFRNFMISYNPNLQASVLNKLYDSLSHNGHLIIGAKESIESSPRAKDFVLVNDNENVYRKKL